MQSLVRKALLEHGRGKLKHDEALKAIAQVLEDFEAGKPLPLDPRPFFPFWFTGISWDKHATVKAKLDSTERRSRVYGDYASGDNDCPAVVLEAVNSESIELPLPPHDLGSCTTVLGSAPSIRQAGTPGPEEGHVTAAHGLPHLTNTNIGRDIPVASPGSTNLPGPFIGGLATLSDSDSPVSQVPERPSPQLKAAKSYYRGKTLIYAKVRDEHHVVESHWLEYLKLRLEQPKVVATYDTQRAMREALLKEGVWV